MNKKPKTIEEFQEWKKQHKQTPQPEKEETKLCVTKIHHNIGNATALSTLVGQFYCDIETNMPTDSATITKNPQLTDNEFSALAGKLVMLGFNVELLQNNKSILDAVHQARRMLQQAIDNGDN